MNLYLFNDNNIASTFGIGTYIKELTSILENSNIHIHIVHLHAKRPKFEIEKMNHIENWYIPEVHNDCIVLNSLKTFEEYGRNVLFLLRIHIPEESKNLIFHFNYNQYHFLAKELKSVFDCKTIATVHYTKWSHDLFGNYSMFHTIKTKPENKLNVLEQSLIKTDDYERLLFKEVDRVIVLSRYMQKLLQTKYQLDPFKMTIIPNGLLSINSNVVVSKKTLRAKWLISGNELLILFVGRLHAVKGLKYLIRSLGKVLKEIPNCRLIIAGSGDYDVYLKEAKDICTKITFTGLLEKYELYELYSIADIGVMPSLFEPFGYVAVEMMMHGLPVVATATSGLNEVVDNACGLKVPVIDYPDKVEIDTDLLAQNILYLLQNPEEARKMSENGRKRYEKMYTSEIFGRNMIEFYQSLCKL